jgi:hypothetical protein
LLPPAATHALASPELAELHSFVPEGQVYAETASGHCMSPPPELVVTPKFTLPVE